MPFRKLTLEDFRNQIKTIREFGSLKKLMEQIPGLEGLLMAGSTSDPDKDLELSQAILDSMTPAERKHPDSIDQERCERIARGAGTVPARVDQLLKDFPYSLFCEETNRLRHRIQPQLTRSHSTFSPIQTNKLRRTNTAIIIPSPFRLLG